MEQLNHKAPKAARKAFEKAAKLFERKNLRPLAALEQSVAIDPELVAALSNLGARYVLAGRFDAISTFRKALAIDLDAPRFTPSWPKPSSTKAGSLKPRRNEEFVHVDRPSAKRSFTDARKTLT